MKIVLYRTVSGATAMELDGAVNGLIEEGYQLYGSPYLSDRQDEGVTGRMAFYQAMTLDSDTRAKNNDAIMHQALSIQNPKIIKPN